LSETQEIVVTAVGQYDGHSTKKNRILELKLKFAYDERVSMARVIMLVGQHIDVIVKAAGKKALKLGTFNFQGLSIDRDGQGHLKLTSDIDYIEHDNLVAIIGEEELLKIKLSADVELEDSDNDD
jgi:hypothetical protein